MSVSVSVSVRMTVVPRRAFALVAWLALLFASACTGPAEVPVPEGPSAPSAPSATGAIAPAAASGGTSQSGASRAAPLPRSGEADAGERRPARRRSGERVTREKRLESIRKKRKGEGPLL